MVPCAWVPATNGPPESPGSAHTVVRVSRRRCPAGRSRSCRAAGPCRSAIRWWSRTAHGRAHQRLHRAGDLHLLVVLAFTSGVAVQSALTPTQAMSLPGKVDAWKVPWSVSSNPVVFAPGPPQWPAVAKPCWSSLGDGEADGAAGLAVDVVGLAADEVLEHRGRSDDTRTVTAAASAPRPRRVRPRRLAGGLDHDPVGPDVDEPDRRLGGPGARGGGVQLLLDGAQLRQPLVHDRRLGPLRLDGGGVRGVRGGDGQLGGGRPAHPGPGEAVSPACCAASRAGAGLRLVDQPGRRLVGGQPEVPSHGAQHLRRGCVRAERPGGRGHRPGSGRRAADAAAGSAVRTRAPSAVRAARRLRAACLPTMRCASFGGCARQRCRWVTVGHGAAKSQSLPRGSAPCRDRASFARWGTGGGMCSTRACGTRRAQAGVSPGLPPR